MIQKPADQHPLNGHSAAATRGLRQGVLDRFGAPYMLLGDFGATCLRFDIRTPAGRRVGGLVLEAAGAVGRITELWIAGSFVDRLPHAFGSLFRRILPFRPLAGHRERGLGSLLVIYALKAACELRLNAVGVSGTIPPTALHMLRNLGFAVEPGATGIAATYRISPISSGHDCS